MGGLFSKPKAPPPEKPPAPMPDPEGPAADAARKRMMAQRQAASGRASTLLSGEGEYGSEKTGVR